MRSFTPAPLSTPPDRHRVLTHTREILQRHSEASLRSTCSGYHALSFVGAATVFVDLLVHVGKGPILYFLFLSLSPGLSSSFLVCPPVHTPVIFLLSFFLLHIHRYFPREPCTNLLLILLHIQEQAWRMYYSTLSCDLPVSFSEYFASSQHDRPSQYTFIFIFKLVYGQLPLTLLTTLVRDASHQSERRGWWIKRLFTRCNPSMLTSNLARTARVPHQERSELNVYGIFRPVNERR